MTEFFHASRKTGHKGSAARHSAYITRSGALPADRQNDLVATFHANLPSDVGPREFWKGADVHLRKNGVAYRSWDVAFPRVLTRAQNVELMKELAIELAGGRPVEAAFHCPTAALEGGEQPHGHFMVFDCVPDGIPRPIPQMFKRYDPVNPVAGGCRKESSTTRTAVRERIVQGRQVCEEVVNRHLALNGFSERVDRRANVERGLPPPKRPHLGQSGVRKLLSQALSQASNQGNHCG